MKRELIRSEDGSYTLKLLDFNESYHSLHGALSESKYIFIKCGLDCYINKLTNINYSDAKLSPELQVLEVGFGSGLNAILYSIYAYENRDVKINYTGIEKYPVTDREFQLLNHISSIVADGNAYSREAIVDIRKFCEDIQYSKWGKAIEILPNFNLAKLNTDLLDFKMNMGKYDVICFDAFSPNTQPELWTAEIFRKLYSSTKVGGILVTYSSKGIVKQALREAGFEVCRLPGPKGKRHIIRATRLS